MSYKERYSLVVIPIFFLAGLAAVKYDGATGTPLHGCRGIPTDAASALRRLDVNHIGHVMSNTKDAGKQLESLSEVVSGCGELASRTPNPRVLGRAPRPQPWRGKFSVRRSHDLDASYDLTKFDDLRPAFNRCPH